MKKLSQTVATRNQNRKIILRAIGRKWTTFKEIKAETGLGIRDVMNVTGHFPYDIIGTRKGYKRLFASSTKEIAKAISYNEGKMQAMTQRVRAFEHQLYSR